MEKNTILSRISQLINNEGINVSSLELEIGSSKGVLSRAINHGTDIQAKWLQRIVEKYPSYSEKWLLTGVGPMLKQEGQVDNSPYTLTRTYKLQTDRTLRSQQIPLYEWEATAGLVSLFMDSANNVPMDYISIPDLPPVDGAIHVRGDSMYPLLKSGDIVLYKQIQNIQMGLLWGEMYLVSYSIDNEEYITIKYVQKSDMAEYVRLVSHNSHHAPSDIPMSSIRAIAIIKASIRYNTMG